MDFSKWLNNVFLKGNPEYAWIKEVSSKSVKKSIMDAEVIISCERHRIKIPILGWVRLKEKGYLPTDPVTHIIKSGTVSCKAGKYYVSVLVEEHEQEKPELNDFGLGIDLGIREYAIISNGVTKKISIIQQTLRNLKRN